jgi:NADPH2:quinone reductase
VLLKGVMVLGFDIRTFARHAPADAARNLEELRALAASGALRPYVGATYRLDDVVDAMRHVGDGRALGKVVLSI